MTVHLVVLRYLFNRHAELVWNFLPCCHVDNGDIFSRQLIKENRDSSVVGMTAQKDFVTDAETDAE
jgi:hypothetical protein